MPIEIRELIIQTTVREDQGSSLRSPTIGHSTTLPLKNLEESLQREVLNLTTDLLKEQKER
ncbi:MAG: DUF5908 family protein [Cytophagales bacterium]|nr:DUF5908 family protein [Cytophagales bacterium]